MQPLWRILIASALASAGAAALAQSASTSRPTNVHTSQPVGDSIGPPQLSNFSIGGKVTQQAQPQPTEIQPIVKPAPHATDIDAGDTTVLTPAAEARGRSRVQTAERSSATATPPVQSKAKTNALPTFATTAASPPQAASAAPPTSTLEHSSVTAQSSWFSSFLWLFAAIAAAAAGTWYFFWQRPRTRLAPAGIVSTFQAPVAEPLRPTSPPAAPLHAAPTARKSSGVVATRLRPWVELQFTPGRVILDGEKAALEFEMILFNSGSAPARDILVEGALFNASPMQDEQLTAFFRNPVAQGNRLPLLAPLQRLSINSAIALSRAQLIPLEMGGRPLFVPLAGFNALYRWGSGSDGQTSTSYLVGKETNSDKLAPFRLDMGPRVFRSLAAREYELRVRQ